MNQEGLGCNPGTPSEEHRTSPGHKFAGRTFSPQPSKDCQCTSEQCNFRPIPEIQNRADVQNNS